MGFDSIPEELKIYGQWVMWRYEGTISKKPTKVPYSCRTNCLASVTDSSTWGTFEECANQMSTGLYDGIGFVLTDDDPYAFIDLDDTKGDKIALEKQLEIYNEFPSYSERSPSKSGLHIIVKGGIPSGRRRNSIEIYSSMRYMTMTGDVYSNSPILDHTTKLNALWARMSEGKSASLFYAGLEAAKLPDDQILVLASNAANSEKFNDLFYDGNWQKYYPSQSEADFALFDMLAFYSENGQQTQRIFLTSKLAERPKSRVQYRINYMLLRCFDRMLPPVDIDGLRNKIEEKITLKKEESKKQVEKASVYSAPPGLVGEIAKFIYDAAPRPVPEIALAGALALMSGIVGRAYNVSGTGLNQYILLLAATGTGKESIASGIDKLMAQVIRTVPAASDFLGPGEIASSQAIIRYMSKGPTSFMSLVGEFGIYLRQMVGPTSSSYLQGLRRFLLDVYNKSGEGKVLRPSIYSDKDKNTVAINSPAFTLAGESTPEKFYESLDEDLIAEGLLPRFTIIEYKGKRPAFNENHILTQPSFKLIETLSTLCSHSLMLNSQNKALHISISETSKVILDKFDSHCDNNINSSDRDVKRHLWNRAHIKALKLAGLVAVGCNAYNPVVTDEIANWAINLVVSDVRNLLNRFDDGEIGIDNNETKQLKNVIVSIRKYVVSPWPDVENYAGKGAGNLHSNRIIPYAYIQRRLACVAVFRRDRIGSSAAIKRAIKILCERGDLQEVGRAVLAKDYGTTALCYMISHPDVFNL